MINNYKNKAIMLLSVIAILAFGAYAFAWSGRYSGWHMGPGMMGGWGSGWFMMAFWILVLLGLILLIKWMLQITNTEKRLFCRQIRCSGYP